MALNAIFWFYKNSVMEKSVHVINWEQPFETNMDLLKIPPSNDYTNVKTCQ